MHKKYIVRYSIFIVSLVLLVLHETAAGYYPPDSISTTQINPAQNRGLIDRIRTQIKNRQIEKQDTARQYYRLAQNYYELGQFDQALSALDESIKSDESFIVAYTLKADILLHSDNWQDWKSAENTITRALQEDWNNPELHLLLAKIYTQEGSRYNAASEYRKTLRIDSTNVDALYRLGLYYRNERYFYNTMLSSESPYLFFDSNMMKYYSDFTAPRNQDAYEINMYNTTMSSPPGLDVMRSSGSYKQILEEQFNQIGVIRFENFGDRLYDNAEKYFKLAFEIDSTHWASLLELGLLAYEKNNKELLRSRLIQIQNTMPRNKETYLFTGLARYALGDYGLARESFEHALSMMSGDEYRIYATTQYLLPAEGPDDQDSREMIQTASQIDTRKYWLLRDPLYLTDENERQIAHYARCAYVSFRFGYPPRNINGLDTDRGKVYIRYGEPLEIKRKRPEAAGHYFEFWYYNDMSFAFDDPWGDGRTGYDLGAYYGIDFREVAREEFKSNPEQYHLPTEENLWAMPYQIASFRGQQSETQLKILYTLPVTSKDLIASAGDYEGEYSRGIFFLNNQLNRTVNTIDSVQISMTDKPDTLQPEHISDYTSVELVPGEYLFSLEFKNQKSGNISMSRNVLEVPSYQGDSLMMSSILLASEISTQSNPPLSNNDLAITPNPARIFRPGEQLHLYYEIYNLSRLSDQGRTRFTVTSDISILEREQKGVGKIWSGFKRILGLSDKHGVSTSQEYTGDTDTERERSIIQIQDWKSGNYLLTITVHDLYSDETVSNNITFRVSESGSNGEGNL